jgi:hypothetical protein
VLYTASFPSVLQRTKEINDVGRHARVEYAHADLLLPSDLADGDWSLVKPFFPVLKLHHEHNRCRSRKRIGSF